MLDLLARPFRETNLTCTLQRVGQFYTFEARPSVDDFLALKITYVRFQCYLVKMLLSKR